MDVGILRGQAGRQKGVCRTLQEEIVGKRNARGACRLGYSLPKRTLWAKVEKLLKLRLPTLHACHFSHF